MTKVLLKRSIEDAGVLVEAEKISLSEPHVIKYEGATFVRSPVPESLKLCGGCRCLQEGAAGNPSAGGWHCSDDGKEISYNGACRTGGWDPEVVVYRRAKWLAVVPASETPESLVPENDEVPEVSFSAEKTEVVIRRSRLPGSAYLAAFLFFTASVMATLWVLQSASRIP